MQQAIRHYCDLDKVFNGSAGTWSVCGQPWKQRMSSGDADCVECKRLLSEYADRMRVGNR